MQCPHCAHPDSIRYGISRGVQRYRCQACRRIFQMLRRGKDPATDLSTLSRRDGDASYRQGSRDPSQDGLSLLGASCPSTPSKPTTDRSLLLHRNR